MRSRGFTLIELMIVVAILAIVAAVAMPIYNGYSVRTFRADAQSDLLNCAQGIERHASMNFTYAQGVDTDANGIPDADTGAVSPNLCTPSTTLYNVTVAVANANTFTIRAAPIAGTPVASDGMMEVDATGARRWDRDNDGGFGQANDNSWSL